MQEAHNRRRDNMKCLTIFCERSYGKLFVVDHKWLKIVKMNKEEEEAGDFELQKLLLFKLAESIEIYVLVQDHTTDYGGNLRRYIQWNLRL